MIALQILKRGRWAAAGAVALLASTLAAQAEVTFLDHRGKLIELMAGVDVSEIGASTIPLLPRAIDHIGQALFSAFGVILLAVVYCYLRGKKEDITIKQIAAPRT